MWYIVLGVIAVLGLLTYILIVEPVYVRRSGALVATVAVVIFAALLVFQLLPSSLNVPVAATSVSDVEAMETKLETKFDAANAKLTSQVSSLETSVKAFTAKDIEQDVRLAKLEGRVDTLESRMKAAEADIVDLKARTKSIEEGDVTVTGSPTDLTTDQAAQALADELVKQGWKPEEINVAIIDWKLNNPNDNGRETFVTRTIRTQDNLVRIFAHPKNGPERAVRAQILTSLKAMPKSESQRALTGRGFFPLQLLEESCFNGNTFYNARTGTAEREKGDVCKDAGDVWWVYVGSDGKIYWDTAVRADCGNPGLTRPPRPKHPKPTAPPTTAPPTTAPPTTAPPTTAPPTTAPPTTAPPTTAPPTTAPPTTAPPTPTPSAKNPSDHPVESSNAPRPSTPAPSVTEPTSKPSSTPSATYTPAPKPTPTPTRTVKSTQSAPPKPTATATVDPCAGGSDNPACG